VRLVSDQEPTHGTPSPDFQADDDEAVLATAPGPGDMECLRLVEAAASEHWSALPDDPEMAVPTTPEGIDAVRKALAIARKMEPEHPDIVASLDSFEATLAWAGESRFAASLASPIGAAGVAVILAAQAFAEGRLPGTRNELLLYAAALTAHALLLPLFARHSQLDINARFLSGEQTLDERFVRWLLSKGALAFAPGALLRALLYGLLIPFSMLLHLVRRKRFLVAVVVVAADLGIAMLGHNLPRGQLAEQHDNFQPGVDIFGTWVAATDPLTNVPVAAKQDPNTGWQLRSSDREGGHEARVWIRDGRLGDSMMRAWAEDGQGDDNKYIQQFRHSAVQLEARWGPPTEVRSEDNKQGRCTSRWLSYQRGKNRLSLKEVDCGGEQPSLQRNFSAPVSRP